MGHVLEVDDLHTEFTTRRGLVRAVDGVSLRIDAGEIVGLVGESGCGKTVLALSVLRLVPEPGHISGGRIAVDGRDVLSLDGEALRRLRGDDVAMSFQDATSALNPLLRIRTQIEEAMTAHDRYRGKEAEERVVPLLQRVRIADAVQRAGDHPHQLSGGMRQRVMIAMGISNDPKLLIADEPTTALDVTTQAEIIGLLEKASAELGMAVLLVTHDMALVSRLCHRVVVMYAGRIVESGSVERIFDRPQHPYTWALLRSVPNVRARRGHRLVSIAGSPPRLDTLPPACTFAPRCPIAEPNCVVEEPPLGEVGPDHLARCWVLMGDLTERPGASASTGSARPPPGPSTSSPTDQVILSVNDVSKHFPSHGGLSAKAVDGVSFELRQGETLGLIGESGCGKSTLARVACALLAPTSGRVAFRGRDLASLSRSEMRSVRRRLQIVFQDPFASLDPRMSAGAIIAEPLVNFGMGRSERNSRVRHLLDLVGLEAETAGRRPHEFSGGQRQRIGIARALALEPAILICDEPVSALDVSIQAQVINLLDDLKAALGLTYLFISHDLGVVSHLADRVAVMYLGRFVEVADVDDVFDRPAHPYTQTMLDAVLLADSGQEGTGRAGASSELPSASSPPSGCRFHTRCPIAVVPGTCQDEEPLLREIGAREHRCACHLAEGP